MASETSSVPAASSSAVGAATAVLAVLIAEPIFAKSDAAAVIISGATNTNAIAALQARFPINKIDSAWWHPGVSIVIHMIC
ncbi:hypothetical protein MMEU_4854 [Mycobacterium marinum str. Europe]|uniref:hypothetical protein n=1 Tax=Mycobacterium marinum TaxID=1781 RepID=UPI000358DA47|nr:hypothetical protein MMEU_4854 [Mycobacterium marinum str. Europe]